VGRRRQAGPAEVAARRAARSGGGWGGVGRRNKVGEEGGWMDKVEGVDLGRPSRSDGAKIRVRRSSKLH
jgi:hypothetical protein